MPLCARPSCARPATMNVRVLGGANVPTCTRCAGSVIRDTADDCGAIVDLTGIPGQVNRERRAAELVDPAL